MAKYLLLKHYRGGPTPINDVPMDKWTPEEVAAHMKFMADFADRLVATGEFVDGQALAPEGTFVLQCFDKAIQLDPAYAKPYYNRGVLYLIQGQLDSAISDFSKTIRINPRDSIAYRSRSLAYERKGDKANAEADSLKAQQLKAAKS